MPRQSAMRSRRLALGLSQAQLAQRAGFKQQHYSQLERGIRPLTTTMIERLAAAMECYPADLLTMPHVVDRDTREEELLLLYRQLLNPKRDALLQVARAIHECDHHPPREGTPTRPRQSA